MAVPTLVLDPFKVSPLKLLRGTSQAFPRGDTAESTMEKS